MKAEVIVYSDSETGYIILDDVTEKTILDTFEHIKKYLRGNIKAQSLVLFEIGVLNV